MSEVDQVNRPTVASSAGSVAKTLVGYCEPFSVEAGDELRLMASSEIPGDFRLDIVRLRCGDPHTGLDEAVIDVAGLPDKVSLQREPVRPGSYVVVDAHPVTDQLASFVVRVRARPSLPGGGRSQALMATWDESTERGWTLFLDEDGAPALRIGADVVSTGVPLRGNRWVELEAGCADGRCWLKEARLPTRSPGGDLAAEAVEAEAVVSSADVVSGRPLLFAAWWGHDGQPSAHFDGRLEAPQLLDERGETIAHWDFAVGIGGTIVTDIGPHGLHGRAWQCPARAVTGSRWDGSVQRWADSPEQYAAIHFHHDDLVDAEWPPVARVTVPSDLPSGLYCFRLTGANGEVDRTPFVVRPPLIGSRAGGARPTRHDVLFLMPTATYLAYANHRMTIEGSDFFPARARLRPEFRYLRDHPELGLSMYEYHADGSGAMYSSMRRPVLNLRPGADGWAFTADTNIVAFLERWSRSGRGFDVATDEDLHRRGVALLRSYRVVVTGSHPEYFSTAMLDAVEGYLRHGGRLMYLGGNGFYWRVAFHPDQPGVMEVRRAEDGTRAWIAEPGESYHEWGGEYGGLWRRLGRPPNLLVGIGFAAQGFDRAAPYKRAPASFDSRAAWIFDGVESPDILGDFGVGGGAAGQEIDRFDERLGSPAHAVVLATADEHSEQMLRTKEELHATRPPMRDPDVRADMVFFETPAGGAVFSVGSIAWFGALARHGYDNEIPRITTNVLDRFCDPTPFEAPAQDLAVVEALSPPTALRAAGRAPA